MSRFTAWIAALLILIGSLWTQGMVSCEEIDEPSPRFGFGLLEPLRRSFCANRCSSPQTMTYVINLTCALKCPELYLPTRTTTESTSGTASSTTSSSSSSMATTQPNSPTTSPNSPTTQSNSPTASGATSATTSGANSQTTPAANSPPTTTTPRPTT